MKKNLYQITMEIQEIALQLEEGELTPELENSLVIRQSELQEKVIGYGYAIKSVEDDISAIIDEIKRLQNMKATKQNAIDRMKEAISNAMQVNGIEKVTSPTLNLSFRKSESLEILDESMVPEEYKLSRVIVNPDKIRIKQLIKSGELIPGCSIVEKLNLQIK